MLDAWETAIGPSAKLRFYTGAQPANCAAAEAGTLLAEDAMASDWAAAASAGAKVFNNLSLVTTGLAAGTIGHYRIYDSTGATCHEQGAVTITGSGGDLTVDNPSIAIGQTINVNGFTKTAPGA